MEREEWHHFLLPTTLQGLESQMKRYFQLSSVHSTKSLSINYRASTVFGAGQNLVPRIGLVEYSLARESW